VGPITSADDVAAAKNLLANFKVGREGREGGREGGRKGMHVLF